MHLQQTGKLEIKKNLDPVLKLSLVCVWTISSLILASSTYFLIHAFEVIDASTTHALLIIFALHAISLLGAACSGRRDLGFSGRAVGGGSAILVDATFFTVIAPADYKSLVPAFSTSTASRTLRPFLISRGFEAMTIHALSIV